MKLAIFHGSIGHPLENWFPWLSLQMYEKGWSFRLPQFPTPEGQNRDRWMREATQQLDGFVDEETVLIGHSCGALLLMNYLEQLSSPVAGTVFASTPFGPSLIPEFAEVDSTFLQREFDWAKIKANAGKSICFHGDDDPFSPLEYGQKFAQQMDCDLVTIPQGGHLNEKAGFKEFPALRDYLVQTFCP